MNASTGAKQQSLASTFNYVDAQSSDAPVTGSGGGGGVCGVHLGAFQLEWLRTLQTFRNEALFCDICIYIDGIEFPCHKVVLCAASSYFKAMFSCDLKESRLGKVYIENISPWTMKRLLDFIYTGCIEIACDNVIDVFNAAAMFQLGALADTCVAFVRQHVDAQNCVDIHMFAAMHGLADLEAHAFAYMLDNFMQLLNVPTHVFAATAASGAHDEATPAPVASSSSTSSTSAATTTETAVSDGATGYCFQK